jgi:hypothetical protein
MPGEIYKKLKGVRTDTYAGSDQEALDQARVQGLIRDILGDVGDVLQLGHPEDMFVNGKDASAGLTEEGQRIYDEMMKTKQDSIDRVKVENAHIEQQRKRAFWERPKG